eukprot:gene2039-2222_t
MSMICYEEGGLMNDQRSEEYWISILNGEWIECSPSMPMLPNLDPPPKKRVRRVNNSPFPRIVKADIRRKYPTMFVNMINMVDADASRKFFETYCVGSCQLIDTLDGESGYATSLGLKPVIKTGIDGILCFVEIFTSVSNAIVTRGRAVIEQELRVPGCKVRIANIWKATLPPSCDVEFIDIEGNRQVIPEYCIDTLRLNGRIHPQSTITPVTNVSFACVEISGEIILHLDSDHRIYKIENTGVVSYVKRSAAELQIK